MSKRKHSRQCCLSHVSHPVILEVQLLLLLLGVEPGLLLLAIQTWSHQNQQNNLTMFTCCTSFFPSCFFTSFSTTSLVFPTFARNIYAWMIH